MANFWQLWMVIYGLAWWVVFWIPAKKSVFAVLTFIPTAIFAFVIPSYAPYSDRLSWFKYLWSALPFIIIGLQLMIRAKKKSEQSVAGYGPQATAMHTPPHAAHLSSTARGPSPEP